MHRRRTRLRMLTVMIVVLGLLGVTVSAMAGPKGTDRPFKSDFTGTRAVVDDPGRCDDLGETWIALDIFLDGGHATHLGKVDAMAEQCIDGATGAIVRGEATYRAANSDELYATYTGQIVGPGLIEVDQVFAGGTGRFEGATGQALEFVTVDAEGNVQGTIEGTISY